MMRFTNRYGMETEIRLSRDYGTKVGYTGLWLVEMRIGGDDWKVVYTTRDEQEAHDYIVLTPDWAR